MLQDSQEETSSTTVTQDIYAFFCSQKIFPAPRFDVPIPMLTSMMNLTPTKKFYCPYICTCAQISWKVSTQENALVKLSSLVLTNDARELHGCAFLECSLC